MSRCLISLEEVRGTEVLPEAARALYGTPEPPALDVDLARLHTVALAMVGKASLSGAQAKLSLALSSDKRTLRVATRGRAFILKPPSRVFPELPANEHVTMLLAARCGLSVPPCGLIRLTDGQLAYLVLRFDRTLEGGKRRQEDLCQLAELMPADKYTGSYERCARLLRRHASEPLVALRDFLRLLLSCWWISNGDMHLKNFSLLAGNDGRHALAPGYDLPNTSLVLPDDPLALTVQGRQRGLDAATWRRFTEAIGLPAAVLRRLAGQLLGAHPEGRALIGRSHLSAAQAEAYVALLDRRAEVLAALAG